MATELEFFFDYGSPFSYLADSQLKALAESTGARVIYRPMLLGQKLRLYILDELDLSLRLDGLDSPAIHTRRASITAHPIPGFP